MDEQLYCVCAVWPFVNISITLIGVVKVTLKVSTAQQLASPPQVKIIYDCREAA